MFVQLQESYPHSPDRLLDAWSDEEFLRFKYARLSQEPLFIEAQCGPTQRSIVSTYRSPLFPEGLLRTLLPLQVQVKQHDIWHLNSTDGAHGPWNVEISGLPVTFSGQASLRRGDGGLSVLEVNAQIVARTSGPARAWLERLGATNLRRTLQQSARVTLEWLASHAVAARVNAVAPSP